MSPGDASTSAIAHHLSGHMDHQGMGMRPNLPVERKWALGLQVIYFSLFCVLFSFSFL